MKFNPRILRVACFSLVILLAFSFTDGTPADLDSGIGILKVDKKIGELKSYLVKTDEAQLKSRDKSGLGDWITSAWTVNLKKAKLTDYFGLKITSIEVYFDGDKDAEGAASNEQVNSFVIYTERPAGETASEDFRLKAWAKYGEPQSRMFSPDYSKCVYDSWFNDNDRMLDLVYGINIETGDTLGYYEASYR